MRPADGKVDPPPVEASREIEAIRQIVDALESFDVLMQSLAGQLTEAERKRVLRYVQDRFGALPKRKGKLHK